MSGVDKSIIELPQDENGHTYLTHQMLRDYPVLGEFYQRTKGWWRVDFERDRIVLEDDLIHSRRSFDTAPRP